MTGSQRLMLPGSLLPKQTKTFGNYKNKRSWRLPPQRSTTAEDAIRAGQEESDRWLLRCSKNDVLLFWINEALQEETTEGETTWGCDLLRLSVNISVLPLPWGLESVAFIAP